VPACAAHNQRFSAIDERIRFYIQSVAENAVAESSFADATIRGMIAPRNRAFLKKVLSEMRPATLDGMPVTSGRVPAEEWDPFMERLGRAIHFKHYGEILWGKVASVNTHIVVPGRDDRKALEILESMAGSLTPGDVTDDRVFSYRHGKTVETGGRGFVVRILFYETVLLYILATDLTGAGKPP
jgi:hypothetical protein